MKSIKLLTIGLFCLLIFSCQKNIISEVGFSGEFMEYSKGLTILDVGTYENKVIFSGDISITEGEVIVELINPDGEIVYENQIEYPNTVHIFESYDAVDGYWRLKYKSIEGKGVIDLHISEH